MSRSRSTNLPNSNLTMKTDPGFHLYAVPNTHPKFSSQIYSLFLMPSIQPYVAFVWATERIVSCLTYVDSAQLPFVFLNSYRVSFLDLAGDSKPPTHRRVVSRCRGERLPSFYFPQQPTHPNWVFVSWSQIRPANVEQFLRLFRTCICFCGSCKGACSGQFTVQSVEINFFCF